MANLDSPNGFYPVKHSTGGTIRAEEFYIASGTAGAIFSGDMVTLVAAGVIEQGAAASAALLGVFAGCEYTAPDGSVVFSKYWPAGQTTLGAANAKAYVYSDPDLVFAGQCSGTPAATLVGALVDLEEGDGSTTTGRSIHEINEDASTTDVFQVLGLVPRADNAWGLNAELLVKIHKHSLGAAAGVGI